MKRSSRLNLILCELLRHPCKLYELGELSERFDAAKSSISEDLRELSELLSENHIGFISSIKGKSGGIRFIPGISLSEVQELCDTLVKLLSEPSRMLGSGFLYTSDIMFDPKLLDPMARIFASRFYERDADYVVTLETKGVPLATLVADYLGIPLVVIRREARYSEGSTVSINYFSGAQDSIHKMSISKRAVRPLSRAIIIDDFMRGGGSIAGMQEILAEFDTEVVGIAVVIHADIKTPPKITDFIALISAKNLGDSSQATEFLANPDILN